MTIAPTNPNSGVFELLDPVLAETTPDVLGLWSTGSVPVASGVSFAPGSSPAATLPNGPIWRVNLPANAALASASLATAETDLATSQVALDVAIARLNQVATVANTGLQQQLAFAVPFGPNDLASPEAELLASLNTMAGMDLPQSYSLGDRLWGIPDRWQQTTQQFQTLLDRMSRVVGNYAWVETSLGQQLQARTVVSWTGDFDTFWLADPNAVALDLHRRSLTLALSSRNTLIRTLALAAQGAIKFSVLAATPGGTILAIPALWRFINQVLEEVKRSQTSQIENNL